MVKHSKLTEYTIAPDRRAAYILESFTCSKIKDTQSESLVEKPNSLLTCTARGAKSKHASRGQNCKSYKMHAYI